MIIALAHTVVQLRLIFQPVSFTKNRNDPYLAYVQPFEVVRQANPSHPQTKGIFPVPSHGMYALRRAHLETGERDGHVIPLTSIRTDIEVTAKFSERPTDQSLNCYNILEKSNGFLLNHFCDKEIFYMFYPIYSSL